MSRAATPDSIKVRARAAVCSASATSSSYATISGASAAERSERKRSGRAELLAAMTPLANSMI